MPTIPIDVPLPESLKQYLAQPHCVDLKLPKPGKIELCLPLGGRLQGLADARKSIPDDCTLLFSLFLQLGPIMASIECLIKVLKLMKPLVDVINGLKELPNPSKVIGAVPAFAEAAVDVMKCFAQIQLGVPMFIRDLILLIAKFLHCISEQIKSLAALMGGLQISITTAQQNGNNELLAQLKCAQENAATEAAATMSSIDIIATILSLAEPFFGIAGIDPIKLPTIGSETDLDSLNKTADTLEQVSQALITVASALPGVHVMPIEPRRPFLGTGWKFPLQVTPTGGIATATAEVRIEEAILIILSTAPGERLMLPDFGCGIQDLVFAPNDTGTVTRVVDLVRRALVKYEPRIDVINVAADTAEGQPNLLLIRVDYRIRDTNSMKNLVYPFFITEGV